MVKREWRIRREISWVCISLRSASSTQKQSRPNRASQSCAFACCWCDVRSAGPEDAFCDRRCSARVQRVIGLGAGPGRPARQLRRLSIHLRRELQPAPEPRTPVRFAAAMPKRSDRGSPRLRGRPNSNCKCVPLSVLRQQWRVLRRLGALARLHRRTRHVRERDTPMPPRVQRRRGRLRATAASGTASSQLRRLSIHLRRELQPAPEPRTPVRFAAAMPIRSDRRPARLRAIARTGHRHRGGPATDHEINLSDLQVPI